MTAHDASHVQTPSSAWCLSRAPPPRVRKFTPFCFSTRDSAFFRRRCHCRRLFIWISPTAPLCVRLVCSAFFQQHPGCSHDNPIEHKQFLGWSALKLPRLVNIHSGKSLCIRPSCAGLGTLIFESVSLCVRTSGFDFAVVHVENDSPDHLWRPLSFFFIICSLFSVFCVVFYCLLAAFSSMFQKMSIAASVLLDSHLCAIFPVRQCPSVSGPLSMTALAWPMAPIMFFFRCRLACSHCGLSRVSTLLHRRFVVTIFLHIRLCPNPFERHRDVIGRPTSVPKDEVTNYWSSVEVIAWFHLTSSFPPSSTSFAFFNVSTHSPPHSVVNVQLYGSSQSRFTSLVKCGSFSRAHISLRDPCSSARFHLSRRLLLNILERVTVVFARPLFDCALGHPSSTTQIGLVASIVLVVVLRELNYRGHP